MPYDALGQWRCDLAPIEQSFAVYLAQEQGLAQNTVASRVAEIHRFLCDRFGSGPIVLRKLRAIDVGQFISRRAAQLSPVSMKVLTSGLRSFFRFLSLRDEITIDLAAAVPAVAGWRLAGLPKFISAGKVNRILRRCDRRTTVGQRDFAVLLLLSRLGLRAGEVVAMTLDDIDWQAGELLIRGKGLRRDRLPLPCDVGSALASYLKRARPSCSTRRVFLTVAGPVRGFKRETVTSLVARAIRRAGVNTPSRGAHLLRHTLATDLLRRGASLTEIGELLRHRHPDTTAIYAKVDIVALKALAPRWPGARA